MLWTSGVVALEAELRRDNNGVVSVGDLSVNGVVVRSTDRRSSGVAPVAASGTWRGSDMVSDAVCDAVSEGFWSGGMMASVEKQKSEERKQKDGQSNRREGCHDPVNITSMIRDSGSCA